MVLKLGGKGLMGGIVFGGDDETAGVPVNAVDNSWTQGPAYAAEAVPAVKEQGVYQSSVGVAGGGVNHHTGGLVDYDYVRVLVYNI